MRAPSDILALLAAGILATAADVPGQQPPPAGAGREVSHVKIRIRLDGGTMTATLEESQAARDFLSLLPLTLTLTDYNSTEKIADLPKKLSSKGAPAGIDPEVGDLTYYAPWGNLAIFYREFGYSSGLVRLGRLDSGVELLAGRGSVRVAIERAER